MTRIRDYPLSRKLTMMNMAVSGTALVLACISFVAYDVIRFRENMTRYAASQAELVSANTITALMFNDPEAAMNTLDAVGSSVNMTTAVIYTPDGKPFASYSRERSAPIPVRPALAPDETEIHWIEGGNLSYARKIAFEGRPLGLVYLQVSMQAIFERVQRYVGIAVVVLGICLLAAFLVSSIFGRAVAEPMMHLAEVADTVSREKKYSVRAEAT
ncbi:MAG: CHASE sensor domain-containing protein, partial [Vicinamibacteria bacterium]